LFLRRGRLWRVVRGWRVVEVVVWGLEVVRVKELEGCGGLV
jgi:hypothetical protein